MNEKQSVKKRPLLYISQPNIQPTLVNVKSKVVIYKKEQKPVVNEVEVYEQKEEITTVNKKVNSERKTTTLRKKFHDFSTKEKVEYFANFPKTMPRPLCEIKTELEIYQGIITALAEEMVIIKTFKEPYKVEIPYRDIENIQIISL